MPFKELQKLGWDAEWEAAWLKHVASPPSDDRSPEPAFPARVTNQHRIGYRIATAEGIVEAILPQRLRHRAASKVELPAVGDWVVARTDDDTWQTSISDVLPRRTCLIRKGAGRRIEEQVIAANVDEVFIVAGLDSDFNLRRIERYLTLVRESGARGVIVLNKMDLCPEAADRLARTHAIAGDDVPVYATSALRNEGVELLRPHLKVGTTVALVGSSGVGKSTLINDLLGEQRQETGDVRSGDERGQHTTRARDLILLPGGALVIDNPGMRELELWVDEEGLQDAFADIEGLAAECRFSNCRHDAEPGCAVREAIEAGRLDPSRLRNFQKILAEQIAREQAVQRRRGRKRR